MTDKPMSMTPEQMAAQTQSRSQVPPEALEAFRFGQVPIPRLDTSKHDATVAALMRQMQEARNSQQMVMLVGYLEHHCLTFNDVKLIEKREGDQVSWYFKKKTPLDTPAFRLYKGIWPQQRGDDGKWRLLPEIREAMHNMVEDANSDGLRAAYYSFDELADQHLGPDVLEADE